MRLSVLAFVFVVVLTACGGGGGSNAPGIAAPPTTAASVMPSGAPSPTPTATATTSALAIAGTAVELVSGAALAGFTVTVGQVPVRSSCDVAQTGTTNPCAVPASPQTTTSTSANGSFTVTVPAQGTYMLTVGKDTTYATLHRTVSVSATGASLGMIRIAALSPDEQAWVMDVNKQRATVSVPASYPNLTVDEYAEEQARAEVAAIVSGTQPYGDPTEAMYDQLYGSQPGSMYGPASVAALIGSANSYLQADISWMSEQQNCANENWQTCAFAGNTGHYINISNSADVWVGMGESATSYIDAPYGAEWAYAMILPQSN